MIHNTLSYIFPATFALLPGAMDTPEARAMLLCIGLQESRFEERVQVGGGPAHGFWQFEGGKQSATQNVLVHQASRGHAAHVCSELQYEPTLTTCYTALQHNDVLACAFARLQLWTQPGLLPGRLQSERGWLAYLAAWRPGTPHHATWDAFYGQAWSLL